ncbi:tRNA modification GTPase [Moheibacter sp.]|uniref:tRNA modification GTPase n=1 Tax=Moheibacter sp. TaxID=1965316 RepID=UPI003C7086F9
MKNLLLILLPFSFPLVFGQIKYEKGYFIDESNNRTECLIRNVDWKNNPAEFEYKLSEDDNAQKGTLNNVREFGIYEDSKYVKHKVQLDRSSDIVGRLSDTAQPIFNDETIFLKVLVGGQANLYQYTEDNLIRYFYDINNEEVKQLVYKRYLLSSNKIATNEQYKRQIFNDLKCDGITKERVEKMEYKQNSLTRVFVDFNNCGKEPVQEIGVANKGNINLTIRPRIYSSSLSINNSTLSDRDIDFGNKIGLSAGLEIEYVLPFNKNKWAIFAEGTYITFKGEKTTDAGNVSGGKLTTKLQYNAINIPVGFRHYFFLNDKSKIFIDAAYVVELGVGDSFVEFTRTDGSGLNKLNLEANNNNFTFGLGYKFLDKYSAQLRLDTGKDILSGYYNWSSDYTNFSFILGYTIF